MMGNVEKIALFIFYVWLFLLVLIPLTFEVYENKESKYRGVNNDN